MIAGNDIRNIKPTSLLTQMAYFLEIVKMCSRGIGMGILVYKNRSQTFADESKITDRTGKQWETGYLIKLLEKHKTKRHDIFHGFMGCGMETICCII